MQVERRDGGADDIVPALDNDSRDVPDLREVLLLEKPPVTWKEPGDAVGPREVVVLDAREREREVVVRPL